MTEFASPIQSICNCVMEWQRGRQETGTERRMGGLEIAYHSVKVPASFLRVISNAIGVTFSHEGQVTRCGG